MPGHDFKTLVPKKKFSQHFLIDPHVSERIITACEFDPQDRVLEIGPGTGMLTKDLVRLVQNVTAVEIDSGLCEKLQRTMAADHLTVINQDFLKFDMKDILPDTKIIGNLPYGISTPIIEKIVNFRHLFNQIFITVQWEFGRRLAALSGTKDYGALSCFVQYYYDVKVLFRIKNTCFRPIPKVTSCFLKLQLRPHSLKAKDENRLFQIIRWAFQMRRKKVLNALGVHFSKDVLLKIMKEQHWDEQMRAENMKLKDFIVLADRLMEMKGEENNADS